MLASLLKPTAAQQVVLANTLLNVHDIARSSMERTDQRVHHIRCRCIHSCTELCSYSPGRHVSGCLRLCWRPGKRLQHCDCRAALKCVHHDWLVSKCLLQPRQILSLKAHVLALNMTAHAST